VIGFGVLWASFIRLLDSKSSILDFSSKLKTLQLGRILISYHIWIMDTGYIYNKIPAWGM